MSDRSCHPCSLRQFVARRGETLGNIGASRRVVLEPSNEMLPPVSGEFSSRTVSVIGVFSPPQGPCERTS